MSEPAAKPVRRAWRKYLLLVIASGLVVASASLWYINTDSFQALVRRRIVAEIERISGGRAEIGGIHTIPFRMQVELRDVTVHGRESADEVPLVHVDHLVAFIKVGSLVRPQLGFHQVVVENPVIHVAFYPDGNTNVPRPQLRNSASQTSIEQIFALSINHFEARRGVLLWDDQKIPLELEVQNAALQMDYSFLRGRYEGHFLLGKVDTTFQDFRPFAWMTTVEFSLGPSFADIKSLTVHSQHSNLHASGRISDFRHPHINVNYQAQIDLADAAAIARRRNLRAGSLEAKGEGTWSPDQFNLSGGLALHGLSWRDNNVTVSKVEINSDYTINDQQVKLAKLQGKLLGGSFSGDADVSHWLSTFGVGAGNDRGERANRKREKGKQEDQQVGAIRLRVRDVSAEETIAALGPTIHSLGRFRPAALASGAVDARWKGSARNAEIEFTADLNPPSRFTPGRLPITGTAQGVYRAAADALELPKFNLSTPASRVQASGTLSASSTLKVSLSTSSLNEWKPLIDAFHGPAQVPFTLEGSATFNGVVSGAFSNPALSGSLQVGSFDVLLPAIARMPEQQVHWDSLSTNLQLSSRGASFHNGSLKRGDEVANFDFTTVFDQGQFTDASPVTLHINFHNMDVAAVQALAGYRYPITGKADFSLQLGGTKSDPRGQGRIHLMNAFAYGEPFAQFDADLRLAQGEAALENIHLAHYEAAVTGSGAYNPSAHTFRLDLEGKNFDLARVRQIQSNRLAVEGAADFTLKGSGTVDAPTLNASVHLRGLTLDHELAGDFDLRAVSSGNALRLTGQSSFQQGTLTLEGSVQIRDGYPATVSLRMDNLDLDSLLRSYLRGQITGHSSVAGAIEMQGPLSQPRLWEVRGSLTDARLDVEYANLHNQEPLRFTFSNQTLRIEQLHLLGEGTDISAHGSVQVSGSHELDLAADGRIDLRLLNSINPDFVAGGLMRINLTVGGTAADPFPQGHLELANGALSYAGLPSGLSEMKGSLIFTRDRVHIDTLTARTGGGTVDLKGDATLYNRQVSFDFAASGRGVRLRYPPGVSSTADGELRWTGTRSASTVTGDIIVNKLAVTPGFDFSSYLERSRQIASTTPANSPLYNVKLDLHVQTAPELQMKTAVARLSGDADLHLRGSLARPVVLGRADILEGEATFNGTKFRLERGDITFANPVAIEPRVDLQASTHVRNYDLNVTVTGTPERLNVNYRSEPPLPQSDIISLLALGRTSQESEQLQQQSGQSRFTDEASALILNQALNATVTNRIQRLFGVSRIKIDPQGLTTETNPTARGPQVTIEQQFANNLSLSYSTNVSQSAQQIIRGEYYFTRNVSAVGTRDQNGVVSFDVRIRRRKK